MIYGAQAYSTLGWFKDPLFTSMLRSREHELANTVIHEMTHATVFVESDADFNETLATFVGNQGAIDYLRSVDGPDSARAKAAEDSFHDDRVFARAISDLRARLEAVYRSALPREGKLRVKQHELDDFPRRYREEIRPKLRSSDFDGYLKRKLNNASILAMERYHGELDAFAALHRKLGSNLRLTVERLKKLADEPHPRDALKNEAR
jgi:predicted aminopeptidase